MECLVYLKAARQLEKADNDLFISHLFVSVQLLDGERCRRRVYLDLELESSDPCCCALLSELYAITCLFWGVKPVYHKPLEELNCVQIAPALLAASCAKRPEDEGLERRIGRGNGLDCLVRKLVL